MQADQAENQPCHWCEGFDLYREYHDKEWGKPLHDDRALFELIILEGARAGISWATVLKKRGALPQGLRWISAGNHRCIR